MSRKSNHRTGLFAETFCRLALRLKGYTIVQSRFRSHRGEVDIVARRGKILAMIEVKARASFDDAIESVLPRQQKRIENAAHDFLARHHGYHEYSVRFDVMLVMPQRWPKHVVDAWQP